MFYGWVIVGVFGLIDFVTYTPVIYSFGVLVGSMTEGLGITLTQASIGYMLFNFTAAGGSGVAALTVKRFGSRWTVALGAFGGFCFDTNGRVR